MIVRNGNLDEILQDLMNEILKYEDHNVATDNYDKPT